MAKIIQENIVITISQLVKDAAGQTDQIVNAELLRTLESVIQELLSDSCVVEAEIQD